MRWWGLIAIVGMTACQQSSAPMPAAEFGRQLFSDSRFSESQFNGFSCATCHSVRPDPEPGQIFSGYSLYEVVNRKTWWGGYKDRLIDAVSFCYVWFMRGIEDLRPDDPKAKALYEYLVSISPGPRSAGRPYTVVKQITDVPRGDSGRGAQVYRAACQSCHGALHSGAGRLTEDAVVLPEYTDGYAEDFPGIAAALVVIEKVRHGQFFGIGGTMPPYSTESLSDADLGALLTYLGL